MIAVGEVNSHEIIPSRIWRGGERTRTETGHEVVFPRSVVLFSVVPMPGRRKPAMSQHALGLG